MPLLTREQILARKGDLPREVVPVPLWGGDVIVRALTAKERDEYEVSNLVKKGKNYEQNFANMRARLVVRCTIDEAGARLFNDKDVDALGDLLGAAVDTVYSVAARLNGITKADEEELARPNSDTAPGADSRSA